MSWLTSSVASVLVWLRDLFGGFTGPDSGLTWVLAIVALTLLVRLVLLPMNLRQFSHQLKMTKAAPEMAEVNSRFRTSIKEAQALPDAAESSRRVRELQIEHVRAVKKVKEEHGFGFLSLFVVPLVVQGLIGFALFRVITEFRPGADVRYGIPAEAFESGAAATFFGAPLSARFTTSAAQLTDLGGSVGPTRLVAFVLIALAALLTALLFRKSVRRSPAPVPPKPSDGPPSQEEIAAEMAFRVQTLMRTRGPLLMGGFLSIGYLVLPIGFMFSIVATMLWIYVQQSILYALNPMMVSPAASLAVEAAGGDPSDPPLVPGDVKERPEDGDRRP